jgi:hypothetical protein
MSSTIYCNYFPKYNFNSIFKLILYLHEQSYLLLIIRYFIQKDCSLNNIGYCDIGGSDCGFVYEFDLFEE